MEKDNPIIDSGELWFKESGPFLGKGTKLGGEMIARLNATLEKYGNKRNDGISLKPPLASKRWRLLKHKDQLVITDFGAKIRIVISLDGTVMGSNWVKKVGKALFISDFHQAVRKEILQNIILDIDETYPL